MGSVLDGAPAGTLGTAPEGGCERSSGSFGVSSVGVEIGWPFEGLSSDGGFALKSHGRGTIAAGMILSNPVDEDAEHGDGAKDLPSGRTYDTSPAVLLEDRLELEIDELGDVANER